MCFIRRYLFILVCCATYMSALAQSNQQVSGTTGTPLGGFGAGAVKFNANTGTFAAMTQPPADAYDFRLVQESKIQFFSKRGGAVKVIDRLKATVKDGLANDDAVWPLHSVNFGKVNGVELTMKAFSPLDNVNYNNMSLPYAFYEVTLTNLEKTSVESALAFQWDGGDAAFSSVAGKGIANKAWAVFVDGGDAKSKISTGNNSEQQFFKSGNCTGNVDVAIAKVAAKVFLLPNQSKKIRFVLAWYDDTDPEIAYYKNLYTAPADVAAYGLSQFNTLQAKANELVNRLRASNLPDWLKVQTQNTLANLSTNSMYKKDGRVAFAEGQWTCFGTMDQMWHARQIIGQLVPFYAWQELRYWARTQMKNGQIHHDFNKMDVGPVREKRSLLVAWDDTEHEDYRNVLKWVDLNCAMIVSTYEIYQMTGDKKEFDFLWPYLKKAGERIFDQVEQYGNKEFPFTFDHSENSYDAGGDPNVFNANFSALAYKVMTILAKEKAEPELAAKYQKAYDTVVKSYTDRYLNDKNFKLTKHAESYYGGQWLSFHLKLGEIWSAANTDFVLNKLNTYYHPYYHGLGNHRGTYDEWSPYILVHHAGLLLNTNRVEQWQSMQKDAYERQYYNRDFVFDHPLNILPKVTRPKPTATNYKSGNQYISLPAIWRNYYDLIGFHRDKRTNELWLKPVLPAELKHKLVDAMFVSPEGYGSISCTESGANFQNKNLSIKTDKPIDVSTLYLADNFGTNVSVAIGGKKFPFQRVGTGYAKELAIKFDGKIDAKGINIVVQGDPGSPAPAIPEKPLAATLNSAVPEELSTAYRIFEAEAAHKSAGIEVIKSTKLGDYVSSCNNFDYLQFSNIDFGKVGAIEFFARVSSKVKGSSIEIVLDNVAGEPIGTCTIPTTGEEGNWAVASCSLNKVTGIHDVILRFGGTGADNLMDLDKIAFQVKAEDAVAPFK